MSGRRAKTLDDGVKSTHGLSQSPLERAAEPAGASEAAFESGLERLEQIVHSLEEGEQPLERSLTLFAEGTRLARSLHQTLASAERQIEMLLNEADGGSETGDPGREPFRAPGEE